MVLVIQMWLDVINHQEYEKERADRENGKERAEYVLFPAWWLLTPWWKEPEFPGAQAAILVPELKETLSLFYFEKVLWIDLWHFTQMISTAFSHIQELFPPQQR